MKSVLTAIRSFESVTSSWNIKLAPYTNTGQDGLTVDNLAASTSGPILFGQDKAMEPYSPVISLPLKAQPSREAELPV